MSVVAPGSTLLGTPEAQELPTVGRRGLEPCLQRIVARVVVLLVGVDPTGVAVEGRRGVGPGDGSGLTLGVATGVGAVGPVRRGVLGHRPGGLTESVVEVGLGVPDGLAIGIGRSHRDIERAPAVAVVVLDLVAAQRLRVDGHVVDVAIEVGGAVPVGVATHAPVAGVGLGGGGARVRPDLEAVDVHRHARRAQAADDVVPVAVVERGGGVHGVHAVVVDAEPHLAVRRHVDVPVVVVARPGLLVTEPDDLAAGRRGRAEPRLHREDVGSLDRSGVHGESVGATEAGRCVGVADDGAGCSSGVATGEAQVVEGGVVGAGRTGLTQAPVVVRRRLEDAVGVVAEWRAAHGDRVGHGAPEDVAVGITDPDLVAVARPGCQPRVDETEPGQRPEGRVGFLHLRGKPRVVVAQHFVLEGLVVHVPARAEGHPDTVVAPWGRGRRGHRRCRDGAVAGPALLGRDGAVGEPDEALLGRVVHPRELATDDDVVAVALDAPAGLAGGGVGAEGEVRVPLQGRRVGHPDEVPAVGVVLGGDVGGIRRVGTGLLPARARVGVGPSTHDAAVVLVRDVVDHVAHRSHVIGVTEAVVRPGDLAVVRVEGEDTLIGRTSTEGIGRPVDLGSVRLQPRDGAVGAGRPDLLLGGDGVERAVGVDGCHAVCRLPVDRGERTTREHPGLVRRERHGPDVAARGCRCPGGHGAVGRREGSQPGAGDAVGRGEVATGVDDPGRDAETAHLATDVGGESGHEVAGRRVEGGDVAARRPVDRREVPTEVDTGVVGRRLDHERLGVERVAEGRDAVPGAEAVGEDVVGNDLTGTTCRHTRRPCPGEAASDIDRVTHDGLAPHDAVDLPRGQGISRHRRWQRPGRRSRRRRISRLRDTGQAGHSQ